MRVDQTNKRTNTSTSNTRNPAQAASARQTRLKPIPPSTSHDATTNPHPSTWPGGIHDTASENGMPTAIAPHYENKRPLPLLYHGKKSKHTDIKNTLTVNLHNVSLRIRCIIDRSNRSNLSKSIKPLKIAETYKIRSKPLRFYQTVKISKQLKIAQTAQCTKQWTTNVLNWPDFLLLRLLLCLLCSTLLDLPCHVPWHISRFLYTCLRGCHRAVDLTLQS